MGGHRRQNPVIDRVDAYDPKRWLNWFLESNDKRVLVATGHWKRVKYLVEDHGDDVDGIEAMRAALKLAGEDAAWEVFIAMCDALKPDAEKPELPDGWDQSPARAKLDYQRHRASLIGKWLKGD